MTSNALKIHLDRYERDVLPLLSPRTQKDYGRHIAILRQQWGERDPDSIKPRDIGEFLDVKTGKIYRNKCIGVLSAVYSKMVGRWYVAERNPCLGVERNQKGKRDRYITDAEFSAVYAMANEKIQIMMDLALITGQRRGDLLSLRWEDVTSQGVYFQQSKTGKKLQVMMSPALAAVLNRARRTLPHLPRVYVMRTRQGRQYTPEGFSAMWQRTIDKAVERGIIASRYTFHDIRAKAVSDSASLEEAFERAGHTSMAMTRSVYDRGTRKVKPLK